LAPVGVLAVEDALLRGPIERLDGAEHVVGGLLGRLAGEQRPARLGDRGAHRRADRPVADVLALVGADTLASRTGIGHGDSMPASAGAWGRAHAATPRDARRSIAADRGPDRGP